MRRIHARALVVLLAVATLVAGCGSAAAPSSSPPPGTPSPSTAPPATPSAQPTATPLPTLTPVPTPSPDFLVGQVVVTVSDDLVVRSEPRVSDDSVMYLPWLPTGTELNIIGGPVSGSGYTWYEVEPVSLVGIDGPGHGWVAMAGKDGEPWIALAEPAVPAKPTGATFHETVECRDAECSEAEVTQTVTWQTPRTKGITIRVYGVTECLARPAHPEPGASGPCLVTHTPLPASVRRLLAKTPALAGTANWSWKTEIGCDISPFSSAPGGPPYDAVVLAASNASGQSIFTIAEPGGWREPLPGEMPC